MIFEQAKSVCGSCYAYYGNKTFSLYEDGSLYVSWELPNGKTEFECFASYERALKEYPLNKLNWKLEHKGKSND